MIRLSSFKMIVAPVESVSCIAVEDGDTEIVPEFVMVRFVDESAKIAKSVPAVIIPPALLVIIPLVEELILIPFLSSAEIVPLLVMVVFVAEFAFIALSLVPVPDTSTKPPDLIMMVESDIPFTLTPACPFLITLAPSSMVSVKPGLVTNFCSTVSLVVMVLSASNSTP